LSSLPAREPLLVISPHLDDGVFACGQLLAEHPGSLVLTVCAGRPSTYPALTDWDRAAGFAPGDDIVALRRAEDRAALAVLGAQPVWLDFLDAQYGAAADAATIGVELAEAIGRLGCTSVFAPLGLFHSDHVLTHNAALAALPACPADWFLYEDALYRRLPELLQEREEQLRARGFALKPVTLSGPDCSDRKRRAIAAYASQLRALTTPGRLGYLDAFAPERYWRLEQ
jgi:LmbE family N-acetylglucosaminyl deacetylase